jgi:thiol-disulfide isomerase/thioredoxin
MMLLALLLLSIDGLAAQKLKVKLNEDYKVTVKGDDGSVFGSMKLKKGTPLTVLGATGETLKVQQDKNVFVIEKNKTNFKEAYQKYKSDNTAREQQDADARKQSAEDAKQRKLTAAVAAEEAAKKKAPEAIRAMFGDTLRNKDKKKVSVDELADKVIGIYFSAHWCPPCRQFTPVLVKFHNDLTKAGKEFEIVFVSSDRSEKAMYDYMDETNMPWLALPHGDSHKQALAQKFGVSGIPMLVIVDSKGKTLSTNGRGEVSSRGTSAYDNWK